jgi:WS/DGAT/MGAT family acyltransferase
MTPLEAMMWELERDPQLSAAFANLTLLDRPPDRERFRTRMAGACRAVPRLRQRVVPAPARLAPPQWLDDPDFDLDRHLRWVDLGGHAGSRELLDLVATLTGRPFDRDRPLWEFVVVEGLEGGRAAMVQRFHHTITDGEGGVRLSVQFLDLEREPPVGAPPAPEDAVDRTGPSDDSGPTAASWPGRTLGAIAHSAREGLGMLGRAVGEVSDVAVHPAELPRRSGDLADIARSAVRQFRVDGRRSPLWTERSLDRWFGTTELDLDTVRRAAHALGASINDVFVAGAAHAAAAQHQRAGTPVEQLRVSIPVSLRQDRSAGGNAFSPTQVLVPAGDMAPAERVRAVHEVMDELKSERVLGSVEATASAVNLLPSAAIVRTGRRVAGSVDFVCSNVRAAPFDLFMGGALVEANYPIGPLAGTAFNLTTMSYRGTMFLGLIVDTAAVDHPGRLLKDLEDAYRSILRAAGVRRRRQP